MARYCTTELKTMPILHWMYEEVKEPVFMRFDIGQMKQGEQ